MKSNEKVDGNLSEVQKVDDRKLTSVSVTPAQITGRASRVNAVFRAGYLFLRYFKVLLMSTFKSIIY